MDKKSKTFLLVFFLLLLSSISFAFFRFMYKHDYIIQSQIDCDPTSEKCFIHHCDPMFEECSGDEKEDTFFYKVAKRNAGKIPLCDPNNEGCLPFSCGENEKDCEVIFCDQQNKQEGEECNDPAQYVIDNPVEKTDEGTVCDPAQDPTCQSDGQPVENQIETSAARPDGAGQPSENQTSAAE